MKRSIIGRVSGSYLAQQAQAPRGRAHHHVNARAGASGETGLDTIVRDRDVAPQERVRERRRDVREALACAFAARKRLMNTH